MHFKLLDYTMLSRKFDIKYRVYTVNYITYTLAQVKQWNIKDNGVISKIFKLPSKYYIKTSRNTYIDDR